MREIVLEKHNNIDAYFTNKINRGGWWYEMMATESEALIIRMDGVKVQECFRGCRLTAYEVWDEVNSWS